MIVLLLVFHRRTAADAPLHSLDSYSVAFDRLPQIARELTNEPPSGKPVSMFSAHARYLKVRERSSYAFCVAPAAAALRIEEGTIRHARLACGRVAAKPWRARPAEENLAGSGPSDRAFRRAAEAALADAKPSGDNRFKIELAQLIVLRALRLAAAGTPERVPDLPASPFSSIPGALHA